MMVTMVVGREEEEEMVFGDRGSDGEREKRNKKKIKIRKRVGFDLNYICERFKLASHQLYERFKFALHFKKINP